jgi:hypothetical protein
MVFEKLSTCRRIATASDVREDSGWGCRCRADFDNETTRDRSDTLVNRRRGPQVACTAIPVYAALVDSRRSVTLDVVGQLGVFAGQDAIGYCTRNMVSSPGWRRRMLPAACPLSWPFHGRDEEWVSTKLIHFVPSLGPVLIPTRCRIQGGGRRPRIATHRETDFPSTEALAAHPAARPCPSGFWIAHRRRCFAMGSLAPQTGLR